MAQAVGRFVRLAANATTVIKTGGGLLFEITINTKGTTANTFTLWDSATATGTTIAVIDTTTAIGTLLYDSVLNNGLTVSMATGVAADITVITD